MYVDKKLQGVLAVQALSRLNRAAPRLGKRTEDLFVLDFFNTADDIKQAFDPFYTVTALSEATDVSVLHEIKDALDDVGVYEWPEVVRFCQRFFDGEDAQQLSSLIDVAAERFKSGLELEDSDRIDFKIKAKQFVKIYGQMAAILPYEVLAWEQLFWFLKFLIPKLPVREPGQDTLSELLDAVDLSSYGLERTRLQQPIALDESEAELYPQNSTPRGHHVGEPELDPLDEIIRNFNERWFGEWDATPEEKRVKMLSFRQSVLKHPDFKEKYDANPDPYNKKLAFDKIMDDVILENRKRELDLYRLLHSDPDFRTAFYNSMRRSVQPGAGMRPHTTS